MLIYRTLIALFLCSLLCACGQGSIQSADNTKSVTKVEDGTTAYQKYINTLDTTTAGNAMLAVKKYKELFTTGDTTLNDRAYAIFESFYRSLQMGLNNQFQSEHPVEISARLAIANPSTYPPKLANIYVLLKDNGFEFIESEGDIQISENRDFIAKWFYHSVSGTMKKYLEQVNKENKEGCDEDGALIISATDLSDRAILWENFVANYPHFVLINNAIYQKQYYLTCLLRGLDNSPILNYDSHKLTEYYQGAYKRLQTKYPDAAVTKMVMPFYETLRANDTAKANRIVNGYKEQKLLAW